MNKKQKIKSIRTQTAFILTILFICLVLIIYLILNTVMLNKINILEDQYIIEHISRVENAFNSELSNLSQISVDWGAWDDTYKYIVDGNSNYKENNLNEYTYSNLNINVMAYIDQSGKYVYAKEMNLASDIMTPISQNFIELINNSPIIANVDPNYRLKGVILLPEGPMMITACPVIRSNKQGPVRGHIVFGRYLNKEVIHELSMELNLELSMVRVDQSDSKIAEPFHLITTKSPILVQKIDEDTIKGYSILNDIYKQPAIGLSSSDEQNYL